MPRGRKKKTSNKKLNIIVTSMLVIAVLLAVLIYTKSGDLGKTLSPALGGVFGYVKYFIPIVLGIYAIYIAREKNTNNYIKKLIMLIIVLFLIDSVFACYQISNGNIDTSKEMNSVLSKAYDLGSKDIGGGVIGTAIASVLTKFLGTTGTVIASIGIAIILVVIANAIPGDSEATSASFNAILGSNWILTIGSLLACLLSQSWDVWVFHKIRDNYIAKHGSTKGGRWIWNNASTMTSQFIDSIVFYIFLLLMLKNQGIVLPFVNCVVTVFAYWIIKVAIALLDTPIFYLCTTNFKKEKENGEEQK